MVNRKGKKIEIKRFKYLKHENNNPANHPECNFCQIIMKEKEILFEDDHIVVVFGRLHHKGHLVIMIKTHEEDLLKLHEKTVDSFMNDTIKIMRALDKAIKPDLFNLAYYDNWDHHIHWNVYPRYKSDSDWGNPPYIPNKGEHFDPKPLTEEEMDIFIKELNRLRKKII